MIELRTFGAIDLWGADGRELRPILAQPKRLALLAYLAAARPGPFHRRDTLLSLFWRERDPGHARAALSRAVHFLRGSLGRGVLLGRGDELGLPPDRFWCDATRFGELLAAECPAEALALHRGEFMAGFFLSDAPEFERWMESERQGLRESAAAAARRVSLASETRGDLALALQWAKAAAQRSPYDEADERRVLSLLGRAGERGAAVEHFRRFARRMREELDLEPSPETAALATAIAAPPRQAALDR